MKEQFNEIMQNVAKEQRESGISSPYEFTIECMRQAWNACADVAAGKAKLNYHEGKSKINQSITYFQSGADNLQVDKQSIISLKIDKV